MTLRTAGQILSDAGRALGSGTVAAVLCVGTLAVWENVFDVATAARLTELSSSSHPLLRQLMAEAPGTYHHSVMVSQLAQAAAERIGANSPLAMAGALFHDVGKLKKPLYFKENQKPNENVHDSLAPEESAAAIIAHQKDGVALLHKHKLPSAVIRVAHEKAVCGYIYSDAGEGESTTDLVFTGHNLIAENGTLLNQSKRFENEIIYSELDVQKMINERRRMTTFTTTSVQQYEIIEYSYLFKQGLPETTLTRMIDKAPFVPRVKEDRDRRCEEIIQIQAFGLKKRLEHTGCKCAVIGISGGLDSTLALLVTGKAFDLLGIDRKGIIAVTMPCFGTTDRTYQNALALAEQLNTTLMEIPINEAVLLHFRDIGHNTKLHDVTYENSQARERTQVLMDIANQNNGMVIGTGDMSELALGWATYNGDHMSMYGVNTSVPKTLVRYLVSYFAETTTDDKLSRVLFDVLDTPVSPELLPPVEGNISQKTEDIVGPYELHDFFLYYIMRFGFRPSKIYRLAVNAFGDDYGKEVIMKCLTVFYKRFFSQQFKRSCLPDGPKVGSVALSPRGDLRMPSDASVALWLEDLNHIN
jgi:NAD+ synthase (glutamine-hydrolysing)